MIGTAACVAVTGSVASGKSLFGRLLVERGAAVLDADDVIHRLQRPGESLAVAVAETFGREFLSPDGAVDRPRLAQRVFGDPEALSRLNALAHPLAREVFREWREADASATARAGRAKVGRVRIGIIPLLFESGWDADWTLT
ncbi:MAG: dephospho-CoA kinase, partial [Kiritimatiellaeota bacterium]|nr:dephospho-CoA kinase [Kiritimatiellota bacterium]